jgi:hypothetical protein
MSGSSNVLDAIIDRMMEKLKRENPNVDYYRKPKKEKVPRQRKSRLKPPPKQKLH